MSKRRVEVKCHCGASINVSGPVEQTNKHFFIFWEDHEACPVQQTLELGNAS